MNLKLENSVKTIKEGYRNFDLKSLTEEEERFIKNMVDVLLVEIGPKPVAEGGELLDKIPRGQRRKLQLYEDKWQGNR